MMLVVFACNQLCKPDLSHGRVEVAKAMALVIANPHALVNCGNDVFDAAAAQSLKVQVTYIRGEMTGRTKGIARRRRPRKLHRVASQQGIRNRSGATSQTPDHHEEPHEAGEVGECQLSLQSVGYAGPVLLQHAAIVQRLDDRPGEVGGRAGRPHELLQTAVPPASSERLQGWASRRLAAQGCLIEGEYCVEIIKLDVIAILSSDFCCYRPESLSSGGDGI